MAISINKVFVLSSQAFGAVVSLLLSVMLARQVDGHQLGQFFFFNAVALTLTSLLSSPLGMWLTRAQSGEIGERTAIKKIWLYLSAGLSSTGLCLILLQQSLAGIAMILAAVQIAAVLFVFDWNATGRWALFSTGVTIQSFFRLLIVAGSTTYLGVADAREILLLCLLAACISLAVVIRIDAAHDTGILPPPRVLRNTSGVLQQLRHGRSLLGHLTLSAVIFTIYQLSDKVVAQAVGGYAGVAGITLLLQWSYVVMTSGMQPLIALVYPKVLQQEPVASLRTLLKYASLFGSITAAGTIVAALARNLIIAFFPSNYHFVVERLWIGVLAGGLFMTGQVLSIWFSRRGNEHFYSLTSSISSLMGILGMLLGGLEFGVTGIVCGHLLFAVSYVMLCTSCVWRSRAEH